VYCVLRVLDSSGNPNVTVVELQIASYYKVIAYRAAAVLSALCIPASYFGWDKAETPVFRDLQQRFEKTAGLAPILQQILKPFGNKIQCALKYGSVARIREHAMSDVDVMVIGRAGIAELSPALREAEERLGREVNVTAYPPEEVRGKIKSRDHFLAAVLRGRKQLLKGGQSDWTKLLAN